MGLSTNLVSGLVSGLDWRTMIDQLIAIERQRVELVEDQKTEYESKLEIFRTINTKLLSFKTQAETLARSNTFNIFTSSLNTDSATYNASDFLTVSTSASAAPGSHTITMNANSMVAQARTISSKSFGSYDSALDLSGEFVVNGRAVDVEISDDLSDIQDKINNLNSGTNATGVTASILTVSSSNYRLILTSNNTGEDAFTIFDASASTENILSDGLGFTDGTTSVKSYISNGFRSEAFSNSTQAVASMLGLSSAQDGTVTIGNVNNIVIDLSQHSLTDIAGAINARATVLGSNVSASVVSSTENGVTTYRLKIENTTSYTDEDHVLQTLGLIEADQGDVAEVHLSDTGNTLVVGGGPIVEGTRFDEIDTTGGPGNNVAVNDTITITGKDHDGATVSGVFDPADLQAATVGELLDAIESVFGLGAGSATIDGDGKIRVEDDSAGDSQLNITLVANNEGGGTLDLGTITASTEGYTMEVQAGKDANVIIDGTAVTSSSNIIDEVIAGVTLNLLTVEELTGTDTTTVNLTISRDHDAIKSSVQGLLDHYNDVMSVINEQFDYDEETETAGLLLGDSTLRSIKYDLVNTVVGTITGLPSTINALSLIGITSDGDGMLSIDNDDFMDALADNFDAARRIFVADGSTTDGDVEYIGHSNDTVAGTYEVNITTAAEQAQVAGSVDLGSGIGAGNIETLTITQGSKVAAITLDGDAGENGSSIDNIVNAINSEFDTEYAQSIMGNVKNTTDIGQTTPITSSTVWSAVYSNGIDAGLVTGTEYDMTFSGHKSNGTEVNGSYTISDADVDTVQGLLSAIEAEYGYEVSATINTYGYLVITDNTTGNSNLDITITEPGGFNLDFGDVTTSNLVSSERNTKGLAPGGDPIDASTKWLAGANGIYGSTLAADGTETISFSGYTISGNAVEGSFTIDDAQANQDDVGDFLSAIETAYNAAGGSVTAEVRDGRIVVKDGTTNSTLGIEIFEPSGKGVDFGTLSGGVTGRYSVDVTASKDASDQLVLTHEEYGSSRSFTIQVSETPSDLGLTDNQTYYGVDVEGTINNESATGSGQLLKGDAPGEGETTSVEGLNIKYTGTDTGAQGDVKIAMGAAELFARALYNITNVVDGYLDFRIESSGDRIDDFDERIEDMEARLDLKMQRMINQFVAMELTLSRLKNQSEWLAGQISSSLRAWW